MYSSADLEKLLTALDKEAKPAVSVAKSFTGWWTGLVGALNGAESALAAARNRLRPDNWDDDAGNAFDVRWKMADDSLKPWTASAAPKPAVTDGLDQKVVDTRVLLVKAIEDAKAAEAAQAAGTTQQYNANGQEPIAAANDSAKAFIASWKAMLETFLDVGATIGAVPPNVGWNGPTGDTTGLPANANKAPGNNSRAASPGGPTANAPADSSAAQDQAADDAGAETGADPGAADQAGADAGGDTGTALEPGTGLAGLPNTPLPITPIPPSGPVNLPGAHTPPQLPLIPPPGGIPYPPGTPLPSATKLPKGAGLGKSVLGGGGGRGALGLGKQHLPDFSGGTTGDGATGPAQAARQMNSRALPTTPQPPTAAAPPGSTTPTGTPASSTPPPMMPPGAMGSGNGKPKPGTATPVVQGRGRSQNRLPGVPPKLRGRTGKSDAANSLASFGAPAAAARRRKAEEKEQVDTVQLLDEELWTVQDAPAPPAVKHGGLSSR
ncbi:hypothetical protein [Kribbella sp. NPDC006257]|uniref:hypothetical protein n=1 Tax=Kribbella sp. NPDC006257 TaxID=3156738 RepID=UPI0033A3A471